MPPQEIDWEQESKRFDEAAAYYDQYRPSYPLELIDCILEKTAISPGARILEIGAGSGKATELFEKRGFELVCIEPGPNLVAAGQRKFNHTNKVTYITSRFEHWAETSEQFDLAFSAQAFHWVPKPLGFQKCARALKLGRFLALFWNMYLLGPSPLDAELAELCREYRILELLTADQCESRIQSNIQQIVESASFHTPIIYRYPWRQNYNSEQFIRFLMTGNGYLGLESKKREEINHRITALFQRNQDTMTMSYLCALYLAQKK
ncbi:MAG TPA: methyltransferase domain-containing protein [Bacillota bacterium]|nr:methyltransferase domain-containing protein [Bacillota bacterium]